MGQDEFARSYIVANDPRHRRLFTIAVSVASLSVVITAQIDFDSGDLSVHVCGKRDFTGDVREKWAQGCLESDNPP